MRNYRHPTPWAILLATGLWLYQNSSIVKPSSAATQELTVAGSIVKALTLVSKDAQRKEKAHINELTFVVTESSDRINVLVIQMGTNQHPGPMGGLEYDVSKNGNRILDFTYQR
jgi:hypothetical protein